MRGIGDSQSCRTGFAYDGIYNAEDPSLIVAPGRIVTAGLAIRFLGDRYASVALCPVRTAGSTRRAVDGGGTGK